MLTVFVRQSPGIRTCFAPRISPRLLAALVRLDDRRVSIAEVCRRVGREAWRLELPRPSYQRLRVLLHEARRLRARHGPSTPEVVLDVVLRARPQAALVDHLAGIGLPPLRGSPP
jgi:hypothetical protein